MQPNIFKGTNFELLDNFLELKYYMNSEIIKTFIVLISGIIILWYVCEKKMNQDIIDRLIYISFLTIFIISLSIAIINSISLTLCAYMFEKAQLFDIYHTHTNLILFIEIIIIILIILILIRKYLGYNYYSCDIIVRLIFIVLYIGIFSILQYNSISLINSKRGYLGSYFLKSKFVVILGSIFEVLTNIYAFRILINN